MTDPGWDDDRLNAAFAARADRTPPAPGDLAGEIRGRLAREPNRLAPRVRASTLGLGLAAAVTVAIVVGVIQPDRQEPAVTPSPAPSTTVAGPTNSPSLTPPVDALFGEPISVSAAIDVADGSDQPDRELLVTGYLSPLPPVPCPSIAVDANPTFLRCPHEMQWLMEDPEQIHGTSFGSPEGPAIHPSFALVEPPNVPFLPGDMAEPLPVVLVGHFHDRRAARCVPEAVASCQKTFVVDRVAAVDGTEQPVTTRLSVERWDEYWQSMVTEKQKDLVEDVDRLLLSATPDATVVSRQLVTIGQVIALEPVLADDPVISSWGNPGNLMWLITAVEKRDGVPVARTFAMIDGSNWIVEVTSQGTVMYERRPIPHPSGDPQVPPPSGDPAAFDAAPTSIVGIPVRDIATLMRDRGATMDDMGRDEFAIRAWYVSPDPSAACEGEVGIHAPTPPCDDARHWLLDRPEQLGVETGQLRTLPARLPSVLNPLLPVDVPFDVPATWIGGEPVPQPVIVLGHFLDHRAQTYAGSRYFVIDALAWTRDGQIATLDALTRMTSEATEDPASVLARIDETSPNDAVAIWTTVVDAADFEVVEPRLGEDVQEFTSGAPVWISRRLIPSERDGRQRLAIEWAYTLDGGSRVWMTECPDCSPDLATTIDIGPFGQHTREIRVFDYDEAIVSVRRATAADGLTWEPTNPERDGFVEAARGPSDREIGVRWSGATCDPDWELRIGVDLRTPDGEVWINVRGGFSDSCPVESGMVTRALMVTFDRPIELDQVRSTSRFSTGG